MPLKYSLSKISILFSANIGRTKKKNNNKIVHTKYVFGVFSKSVQLKCFIDFRKNIH